MLHCDIKPQSTTVVGSVLPKEMVRTSLLSCQLEAQRASILAPVPLKGCLACYIELLQPCMTEGGPLQLRILCFSETCNIRDCSFLADHFKWQWSTRTWTTNPLVTTRCHNAQQLHRTFLAESRFGFGTIKCWMPYVQGAHEWAANSKNHVVFMLWLHLSSVGNTYRSCQEATNDVEWWASSALFVPCLPVMLIRLLMCV